MTILKSITSKTFGSKNKKDWDWHGDSELYFEADNPESAAKPFVEFMGYISWGLACFDDSRVLEDDLPDFKSACWAWSLHPRFSVYKERVMVDLT